MILASLYCSDRLGISSHDVQFLPIRLVIPTHDTTESEGEGEVNIVTNLFEELKDRVQVD